jgi:hypothetical protein
MTVDEWEDLYTAQDGLCAICGRSEQEVGGGRLHVDHDHADGTVRGLLCVDCNHLIGKARDDERTLLAAVAYLRRHARRLGREDLIPEGW